MPITDLTGCTWVGNSIVDVSLGENFYIDFNSNSTTFDNFIVDDRGRLAYAGNPFGTLTVFDADNNTWTNEAYKTIEITGGTDTTNATLIAWLGENGTLTAPEPEPVVATKSSFNSFKLNNNVLTFNGRDFTLNGTATITDTNNSSFKGISAIDNGNGTITLNVNGNEIVCVKKILAPDNALLTSEGNYIVDSTGGYILTSVATINFSVNKWGTIETYQAEEGMTWEEWINSAYNTDGEDFYLHTYEGESIPNVMYQGEMIYSSLSIEQLSNTVIIENEQYRVTG